MGRARAVVVSEGGSVEERLLHRGAVLFEMGHGHTEQAHLHARSPQLLRQAVHHRGERDVVVGGDGQRALG